MFGFETRRRLAALEAATVALAARIETIEDHLGPTTQVTKANAAMHQALKIMIDTERGRSMMLTAACRAFLLTHGNSAMREAAFRRLDEALKEIRSRKDEDAVLIAEAIGTLLEIKGQRSKPRSA